MHFLLFFDPELPVDDGDQDPNLDEDDDDENNLVLEHAGVDAPDYTPAPADLRVRLLEPGPRPL